MDKKEIHQKLANCSYETTITVDNFTEAYGNNNKHHQTKESRSVILARTYNLNVEYDEFLKTYKFNSGV
jgi:hypothetical protein